MYYTNSPSPLIICDNKLSSLIGINIILFITRTILHCKFAFLSHLSQTNSRQPLIHIAKQSIKIEFQSKYSKASIFFTRTNGKSFFHLKIPKFFQNGAGSNAGQIMYVPVANSMNVPLMIPVRRSNLKNQIDILRIKKI